MGTVFTNPLLTTFWSQQTFDYRSCNKLFRCSKRKKKRTREDYPDTIVVNFCVGDFITSGMRARVFVAKGLLVSLPRCMQLNQYAKRSIKSILPLVFQINEEATTILDCRDSRYESLLSHCPLCCSIGTKRIREERKNCRNSNGVWMVDSL